MKKQLSENSKIPLSSSYTQLKVYAWFSIILEILSPIIKDSSKIYNHGIRGLLTAQQTKELSYSAQIHNSIIVIIGIIAFVIFWVRANIILLRTEDQSRANNIFNWLIFFSFIQFIIPLLPKPDWLASGIGLILLLATLSTAYKIRNPSELQFNRMSHLEIKQKVLMSAPVTFIILAVPYGFLQGFDDTSHNHSYNLSNAIFGGLFFGTFMTFILRRKFKKVGLATGFKDPKKQQIVYKAIKTGKLPEDPEVLKILPEYVNRQIESDKRSKKPSIVFIILLGLANLIGAIIGHSIIFILLGISLFILAALFLRAIKLNQKRLYELKSKLDLLNKEPKR